MAYIDKVKEEIGGLKVIFAILIATDISLIAWLIQNYGRVNPFLFLAGLLGTVLVALVIVWSNSIAYRKINQLEDL